MNTKAEIVYTKEDIGLIAKNQHRLCLVALWIIMLFGASVVCGILQMTQEHVIFQALIVLDLCVKIAGMVFIYKLAAACKIPRPWVYVIAMFFPLVNLLAIAYVIQKATKLLRAHHIRVGIMGYVKADLEAFVKN